MVEDDTERNKKVEQVLKNINKELMTKMPIWRLVLSKVGTYLEIEDNWTFNDIMEGNEILDIKEDLESISFSKLKEAKL